MTGRVTDGRVTVTEVTLLAGIDGATLPWIRRRAFWSSKSSLVAMRSLTCFAISLDLCYFKLYRGYYLFLQLVHLSSQEDVLLAEGQYVQLTAGLVGVPLLLR